MDTAVKTIEDALQSRNKQLNFFFSLNRFRRAMAKQYVRMAFEMISDVKKMSGEKEVNF